MKRFDQFTLARPIVIFKTLSPGGHQWAGNKSARSQHRIFDCPRISVIVFRSAFDNLAVDSPVLLDWD